MFLIKETIYERYVIGRNGRNPEKNSVGYVFGVGDSDGHGCTFSTDDMNGWSWCVGYCNGYPDSCGSMNGHGEGDGGLTDGVVTWSFLHTLSPLRRLSDGPFVYETKD